MSAGRVDPGGWLRAHLPDTGAIALAHRALPELWPRGSLMLEFTLLRGEEGPLPLLHLPPMGRDGLFLSIGIGAEHQLGLIERRGAAFHALSIDVTEECLAGGRMRLIWSWDSTTGTSLLTLEALDQATLRQRAGTAPLPPCRAEVAALVAGAQGAHPGPRVDWLAFGDHVQPVGPGACFAPATPIATPGGLRPAGSLQPGDLVETVDAGPQPVLWSGRVSLPALGALRPVRLSAPSFADRTDLWLLPQHRVALAGPAVDYLFGEDEVLIAARHLVDGCSAQQPDRPCVLGWQGIMLEGHHLLIADGCRLESLSAGRLARQPALARTTALAALAEAGTLPVHATPVRRELAPHEAQALAMARTNGRGPLAA